MEINQKNMRKRMKMREQARIFNMKNIKMKITIKNQNKIIQDLKFLRKNKYRKKMSSKIKEIWIKIKIFLCKRNKTK